MQTPTIKISPVSPFPATEFQKIAQLTSKEDGYFQYGYVYSVAEYKAIDKMICRHLYLKNYSTDLPAGNYLCIAFKNNADYLNYYQRLLRTYLKRESSPSKNVYSESFELNNHQVTELRVLLNVPKITP